MIKFIPLLAIALAFVATAWRIVSVRRGTGDKAWAVGETSGAPRWTGIAFALALFVIGCADAALARSTGVLGLPVLVGSILAVLGALVMIIAQIQMGRAWRIGIRPGDAPELVSTGLYRFSRNPIYLGMALLGLGTSISSGLWWAWVAFFAFLIATDLHIRHEEEHLSENFGDAFSIYCAKVRRWI